MRPNLPPATPGGGEFVARPESADSEPFHMPGVLGATVQFVPPSAEQSASTGEPAVPPEMPVAPRAEWSGSSEPHGDLYKAVIRPSQLSPRNAEAPERPHLEVEILNDHTISVDGTPIILKGHSLFAWNALLLHPEPATSEQLHSLGFDTSLPGDKIQLIIKSLARKLAAATGSELLTSTKNEKEMLFELNASVSLIDLRPGAGQTEQKREQETTAATVEALLKNGQLREDMYKSILKQYRDHPAVFRRLRPYIATDQAPLKLLTGDDPDAYSHLANQYRLLGVEGEQRMFPQIEAGIAAFARSGFAPEHEDTFIDFMVAHEVIFGSNVRLVLSIAKPLAHAGFFSYGELAQYGMQGLSQAIARFDYTRGYKFSTQATWWIRQAILRSCTNEGRLIRIPAHVHDDWLKATKNRRHLRDDLQREPTLEEIATAAGLPASRTAEALLKGDLYFYSLDRPLGDQEDDLTLSDIVSDPEEASEDLLDQLVTQLDVSKVFAGELLDTRQKVILALRFGVFDHIDPRTEVELAGGRRVTFAELSSRFATTDGNTQKSISALLGVRAERISQLEAKAIDLARRALENTISPQQAPALPAQSDAPARPIRKRST